jgi:hypothetical protein
VDITYEKKKSAVKINACVMGQNIICVEKIPKN